MAARKLIRHVSVANPEGELVVLGPDSDLPDWAQAAISNPKAWDDGDRPTGWASKTRAELDAEVARRNGDGREQPLVVGGKGNKPDLVAALEADDAAQAGA